jgi:hypothetical protein
MDAEQAKTLNQTWASTIRTEELCKVIVRRLDDGDTKLANHDQRLQVIEQAAHDRQISSQQRETVYKKRSKIFMLVAGAISIPAANWLWDWASRHFSAKP